MLRKFLAYLALGLALNFGDLNPATAHRPTSAPVAGVTFANSYFIQVASTSSDVVSNSIKVPITVTAGHALFVAVVEGSNPVITLTDKSANSFTRLQTDNNGNLVRTLATYYSLNIKGGVDTVTAAFNGGANHTRLIVAEYQGLVAVDTTVKTQADAGNPSLIAPVRTANEVALCAIETNVDTLVPVGFTLRKEAIDMGVLDSAVTPIGNVACGGTLRRSQSWLLQLATFKTTATFGNLPQTVTVRWHPSAIGLPDSILWYYLEFTKNGYSIIHPITGANSTSGSMYVNASSKDTLDSAVFYFADPPDSAKTADYVILMNAVSSRHTDSTHFAGSRTTGFLYRRKNVLGPQLPLDSVPISVKMVVPKSFGIFGDSFKLYRRMYADTNSVNAAAMSYIGTLFPKNTTFVAPYQLRTNRYSYYLTPYLFGQLVDTIYLGTLEVTNR